MRIDTEATRRDIIPPFNWIGGLIGAELDKCAAAFEKQERNNPLLTSHFRDHFSIEFALATARQYQKATGRLPKGADYDELYSFLFPTHRIHQALPPSVRKPFEGRLRTALNVAHGLRPFAYEISIATHLMQKGWDVEFADYAGLGRFDFLARQGAVEIEIECKATSGDTGRKVHRQEVNRLADLILPATKQLADTSGCHLLTITLPRRLGKSIGELSCIASAVSDAADQRAAVSSPHCSVDYRLADAASWPEPEEGRDMRDFFEAQFGIKNAHLLIHGRRGGAVVAVMITSSQADSVVKTIADQAKEAADQCSGTRPALIMLHLIDPIGTSELREMLNTANGMHTIAGAVFTGTKRQHVDSVAFTVPQRPRTDGRGGSWLSGDVLILNNPQPQFPCEELRTIFRAT